MIYKVFSLLLFFTSFILGQTHFTIPQNVWRITLEQEIASANWKGHDGKNGFKNFNYKLNGNDYSINQNWINSLKSQTFLIEYGFTDKSTFFLNIPRFQKFEQVHTWSIDSDSNKMQLEDVLNQYFPKNKSNSGLSDVTIGMKMLFYGNPAWRGGKNKYSIFAGIDATFPFGERLKKYYPNDIGVDGIPNQFKQLPIGNGLTKWKGSIFGELYRKVSGRLININWLFSLSSFSRGSINPSYSFLWIQETRIDSISKAIGNSVLFKQGPEIFLSIQGQIELLPKRIFLSSGMDWMRSGRDQYFSSSDEWDTWMTTHGNYDTKKTLSNQYLKFNFLNVDPLKQKGPIPFELEVGARWYVPFLTYHTYGYTSSWIKISSYFQAW